MRVRELIEQLQRLDQESELIAEANHEELEASLKDHGYSAREERRPVRLDILRASTLNDPSDTRYGARIMISY